MDEKREDIHGFSAQEENIKISLLDIPKTVEGRLTCCLASCAFVTMLGSSVPHGFNTGVLNAPEALFRNFINESYIAHYGSEPSSTGTNLLWALLVSIYLVGGMAGAFSAGDMANYFGRKKALLIIHVFVFIASVLFLTSKIANSFEMLIVGRFITGFGCGAGAGLVPMYLTEIAPINIRGGMGVLHQFGLTLGILISQICGLKQLLGTEDRWPYLLGLQALMCLPSCIVMPFMPESPRYLYVSKNDEEGARKALQKFRGVDDVDADIQEMQMELRQSDSDEIWTFRRLFRSKEIRLALLLVCSLATVQQLSGINVVFYYSTSVFTSAGIPVEYVQYATLGTGVINVIMTGISVPLMDIDCCGRRPLLLIGMVGTVFFNCIITMAINLQPTIPVFSYISIICVCGFVICFAIGLGSIPQFIGAELFKQGPRPPAMSVAGFLNWLANFLVGMFFPTMAATLGEYSFLVFVGFLVSFGIFIFFKLPETKNKFFEDISRELHGGKDKEMNGDIDMGEKEVGEKLANYQARPSLIPDEHVAFIRRQNLPQEFITEDDESDDDVLHFEVRRTSIIS